MKAWGWGGAQVVREEKAEVSRRGMDKRAEAERDRQQARREKQRVRMESLHGWVRVTDAEGRLIAEVDPVTRRRVPVGG